MLDILVIIARKFCNQKCCIKSIDKIKKINLIGFIFTFKTTLLIHICTSIKKIIRKKYVLI